MSISPPLEDDRGSGIIMEEGTHNRFPSNTPPPLPPKPKKKQHIMVRREAVSRPPLATPPPLPGPSTTTELLGPESLGNAHKRKLSLTIPGTLSVSPLVLSSPSDPFNVRIGDSEGATSSGVAACKSPKLVTPGQRRIWEPVMCTICMDDLFAYPESESDVHSQYFCFPTLADSSGGNEQGNLSQPIPQPETLRPTVSTRCGHLFHTECINKWFKGNMEKEIKEFPYCKREMMANDTHRIYPIFEDL